MSYVNPLQPAPQIATTPTPGNPRASTPSELMPSQPGGAYTQQAPHAAQRQSAQALQNALPSLLNLSAEHGAAVNRFLDDFTRGTQEVVRALAEQLKSWSKESLNLFLEIPQRLPETTVNRKLIEALNQLLPSAR
jgi:hypothetical protein